jgi:hypothetical protein
MSTIDDLLNKLDEEVAHLETVNWMPPEGQKDMAEGDLIAGTILAIGTNQTTYGEYHIVTVDPSVALVNQAQMELPAGTEGVAVHCMGTVFTTFFKENDVRVGGDFAVRYQGRVPSKTAGREPYRNWRIAYEAPTAIGKLDAAPVAQPAPVAGGSMLG